MERTVWTISSLISLILLSCIAYVFYFVDTRYEPNQEQLSHQEKVTEYLTGVLGEDGLNQYAQIPTGVFLQSMHFKSANQVHVSGYLWQTYTKGEHDGITRGFTLPESVDSSIEQVFTRDVDGKEIVGWYFESLILERFDYSDYPLDNKTFWLRLWHKDIDKKVLLVPDLTSYASTELADQFGIDSQIVLPGFKISESFFSFRNNPYDATLGLSTQIFNEGKPELYFNIAMKRHFLAAFLTHMLPIILVTLIAFALCLNMNTCSTRRAANQSSATGMISSCAGLIFVIVLLHMSLRRTTIDGEIAFLETLYLLVISTVTFLAYIAVGVGNPEGWVAKTLKVGYHNNIIAKACFWPVFLLMVLLLSIIQLL